MLTHTVANSINNLPGGQTLPQAALYFLFRKIKVLKFHPAQLKTTLPVTALHSLCYGSMCACVQVHVGTPGPQMGCYLVRPQKSRRWSLGDRYGKLGANL